jgi:hypothetical protein
MILQTDMQYNNLLIMEEQKAKDSNQPAKD